MELKPKYGLFTAFTMIVGIVIGSGIFFKADDILTLTGGNIALGALAFAVAAIAIVFGGLAFAQLASLTDSPGGLVAYAQEFGNRRLACAAGWFQTFFYYPSLISVVSSVVGVYLALLFGQSWSLGTQVLVGGCFLLLCYLYNTLSPKFGGAFQRLSSVVKLIPLLLFAAVGMLFGDPTSIVPPQTGSAFAALGWTAALAPIAFSFDGWIVATSIAHEVRDAKRNLRIALIAAPAAALAPLVRSSRAFLIGCPLLGAALGIAGLVIAVPARLSAGGTIALVSAGAVLASRVPARIRSRGLGTARGAGAGNR